MPNIPGGREYIPRPSKFNGVADSVSGVVADARRIRTALVSRGMIGDMEYGLDIRNDLFEVLSQGSRRVAEIESRISEGIERLCPGVDLEAVAITFNEGQRAALLGITLNSTQPDEEPIDLIFRINDFVRDHQRHTVEEVVFPF